MDPSLSKINDAIKEMESIQAQIGEIQVSLLQILTDDQIDQWDEAAQVALIKLEHIQRYIGETQVELLRYMPTHADLRIVLSETATEIPAPTPARHEKAPPQKNPAWTDPRAWLADKGIQIRAIREPSGLDDAADRAANFLGEHYQSLSAFYEAIKRQVNGSHYNWFSVKDIPGDHISTIISFGNMLKDCSFLSDFHYVKKDKSVFTKPLDDGRVKNFFTGDWLERYSLSLVRRVYQTRLGPWDEAQVLHGFGAQLPGNGETEFDILFGITEGNTVWLECKTGQWQNYVSRLKEINQRYLHLPAERAALVLLDSITEADKASASTLSGLSVLHLSELANWLAHALGEQKA